MTYEEWKQIADAVSELSGWNFAQMRTDRDPVPWDYMQVTRAYLRPADLVLDIGTGGGERFLELAAAFASGTGVDSDPEMIRTAQANVQPALRGRVDFQVMEAQRLDFADATFDVVLNRQAPLSASEVTRVLKPEGYFITQQVAAGNMRNLTAELGGPVPGGAQHTLSVAGDTFAALGCRVVAHGVYDVRYFVQDLASLVFWLKAVGNPQGMEVPEAFNIEQHWRMLDRIVAGYRTPRGIETNERRELLIVQKHGEGTARP